MGRTCYICNSVHREEYDKLRLSGKPVKEIYLISQNTYHENNLRYWHFQKHFMNHLEALVNESVKANRLRDQYIKEVVKKDMDILRMFSKSLDIVTEKLLEKAEHLDNPVEEEMYLRFAAEQRMLIEQYLKWGSKLQIQDTSEDTFRKILRCMEDFPVDLIAKFTERWKEYGGSNIQGK
jgi:ribonucleotide reductase alpha subunit